MKLLLVLAVVCSGIVVSAKDVGVKGYPFQL